MFKFIQTADGSPSLRVAPGAVDGPSETSGHPLGGEPMHSLVSAFGETVYIYGTGIDACLSQGFTPRILSVGLGLGYVEILSAALFLKHGLGHGEKITEAPGGESFELVPELNEWFTAWALGDGVVPDDFRIAYESILERTAAETKVEACRIRDLLKSMLSDGRWILRGPLSASSNFSGKFGMICFDAFSSRTSPELWTENFLYQFFGEVSAPHCVITSYACTGAFKRSLEQLGFKYEIRRGYAYKRASTFAQRS